VHIWLTCAHTSRATVDRGRVRRYPPDIELSTSVRNAAVKHGGAWFVRRVIFGGGPGAASAATGRRIALRAAIALALACTGLGVWVAAGGTVTAGANGTPLLAPLDSAPVPTPPDEATYIKNTASAVKLGKALFWDMQAGSDGRQACATCHFNAGADNRSRNQINPRGGSFTFKGANAQLSADDFPFHKLADPNDAASAVLSDTSNVAGSQGVFPSEFNGVTAGEPADDQTFATSDPDFRVGVTPVRRSTGRNTPSVINAVFNFRNFWDGRAQNEFNGVSPFGTRDTAARVGEVNAGGGVDQVPVTITNASLASQAVGPPGNPVEMSSNGRTLSDIGRKLLSLRPLRTQIVSRSDSVLGNDVAPTGRGINESYADLIKSAFQPKWWNSDATVAAPNGRDYNLMEYNFSLFWGLAIQAYESTLVSDDTPVDRFFRGDSTALSPAAVRGLGVFQGKGDCTECHRGPALTSASTIEVAGGDPGENGTELDKLGRWIDIGFENIGVRPTAEDPGLGGVDGTPAANPLSVVRLIGGLTPDAVDGTFKVPGLRNVELTAPYFHNGGTLTLRQVVDFYNRGGDFNNAEKSPNLVPLGLTDQEKDDLVEFLKALTDPRVKNQSAPFDHPELYVPVGEKADANGDVLTDSSGRAIDCFKQVKATGRAGGAPLAPFPTFTGPACDPAPDLHNPAPVPPDPTPAAPGPVTSGPAPAAPASQVQGATATAPAKCVVPGLRGRSVAQARRVLARSQCKLGLVLTPRHAKGRMVVSSQRPSAGTKRPLGTRVAVRVRVLRHKR
jgi:cytochrome c peroxidase